MPQHAQQGLLGGLSEAEAADRSRMFQLQTLLAALQVTSGTSDARMPVPSWAPQLRLHGPGVRVTQGSELTTKLHVQQMRGPSTSPVPQQGDALAGLDTAALARLLAANQALVQQQVGRGGIMRCCCCQKKIHILGADGPAS